MQQNEHCKKDLSSDIYWSYIYVFYIVLEIVMEKQQFFMLITHGMEAPLYTKIYNTSNMTPVNTTCLKFNHYSMITSKL